MKVLKQFFCIQEQKTYKLGDSYTGKRKDLKGLVEYPKPRKSKK
jgi:hypothetical protein